MDAFPSSHRALACALLLLASSGPTAAAAELTRDAAMRLAIEHHPALRADAARRDAIAAQAVVDALPPPDTLGMEVENVGGSGDVSALRGAEATLRFGRTLERGGKRQAREARGAAQVAVQDAAMARRRLDVAAEAARRWGALAAAEAALAQAREAEALAQRTEAEVASRVRRGVAPDADLPQAAITRLRAALARERAEHERVDARFALAEWTASAADDGLRAAGDLFDLPAAPDFEALAARLPAAADAATAARELARIDAERGVARATAAADWTLGVGVRRLEALDDQALVLSFAMPLGAPVRADATLARLGAEERDAAARAEAALLDARRDLHRDFQELRHAAMEFETLDRHMIPAAERGLALAREGYDAARLSFLQLAAAQGVLSDLHRQRIAAAERYQRLWIDIRRAVVSEGELP